LTNRFIRRYYGQPDQICSWNEFHLKPQVAERVVKAHGSPEISSNSWV
jgi:hypothetical protein